jgi:hypothetical protein
MAFIRRLSASGWDICTVGITLDTYSHVLPGLQEEAARRIDVALRAALEGQTGEQKQAAGE